MTSYLEEQSIRHRRLRKRWIVGIVLSWWIGMGTWHTLKPMPPGTDIRSSSVSVATQEVQFLFDLTRAGADGQPIYEQRIFDEIFRIIDQAKSFIVADFFLVNDLMGSATDSHREISREIVDHLLNAKRKNPELSVLFITDPINDVYGGMHSTLLDEMRMGGITVVITDLRQLRDSNPLYSPWWRTFIQWWGNSPEGGAVSNPFSPDGSRITLRSWLALLNFKANHRKLIVADREDDSMVGLVTSANPHDASSAHSNVAVRFRGSLAQALMDSELALARFSGWRGHVYANATNLEAPALAANEPQLAFLTEESIRDHLMEQISATRRGDAISIATFYLSDRKIIQHLLDAAARNVDIRLILDPNRDAFGRQKDGVPNRPVANELVTESADKIQVRWYRTHGEQFHVKMALIRRDDHLIASVGSANLTRRNLANYNLEANIGISMPMDAPLAIEMQGYFDRLWNNDGAPGTEFTAPFGAFQDKDRGRYWRYRIMEATGLSTF